MALPHLLRRAVSLVALVPVFAGTLVALPVFTRPAAAARPVHPLLVNRSINGAVPLDDSPRAARIAAAPHALLAQLHSVKVSGFDSIGVTWDAVAGTAPISIRISTHSGGRWTGWTELEASDIAPDKRVTRTGTDPIWVGDSDGYSVEVRRAGAGRAPTGLKVTTIDPGASPADANAEPSAVASASAGHPPIVSRAQWGADERLMDWDHEYSPSVKVIFIHHTDSTNNYSRAQAPAQIRAIYAYHSVTLGWGDIGYNYIVDKYGTVYEGRSGGVDTAVIGGHTYGFNDSTSGIALLGTFTTAKMSSAMFSSLEHLMAWKLSHYYRNPQSTQALTAGYTQRSGTGRSYVAGRQYPFNVISGHRDGFSTACPGNQVYSRIPQMRIDVARLMGARLYDPIATPLPGTLSLPGGIAVSSHFGGTLNWKVTIQGSNGGVLATYRGRSTYSMTQRWSLLDGLLPVALPGTYRVTLSADDGRSSAYPAVFTVTLGAPDGGQLYPQGTFLKQGSSYWRVEQLANGSTVKRAILPSAVQTYPTIGQAVTPPSAVLAGIPDGAPLGWADGTLVTAGDGVIYVMTNGVFRLLTDLTAYGYVNAQVLTVPASDIARYATRAVLSSANHPIGSVIITPDGPATIVRSSSGQILRRQLSSSVAAQSWAPSTAWVSANSADLSLELDQYVRGFADGTLAQVDGQLSVLSFGNARPIVSAIAQQLGFHDAVTLTSADLGHALAAPPAAGTAITTYLSNFVSVAASPNKVTRVTTWPHEFYGTPEPTPIEDPARP